jgi:Rhodopirellula transposase DDE domain
VSAPLAVNGHDFPGAALGRAVPYGIDDLQHNEGAVSGGMSAAPPACAVTAVGQWWEDCRRVVSPRGTALLSLADGGGRHGGRSRVWPAPRQSQLSERLGLQVTGCHDPTGGSQWHPMEHRVCSQISRNGAGQLWRTVETRRGGRRGTTATTGRRVIARRLAGVYHTGKRVADVVMNTWQVEQQAVCPPWNETLHPRWDDALAP